MGNKFYNLEAGNLFFNEIPSLQRNACLTMSQLISNIGVVWIQVSRMSLYFELVHID